MSKRNKQKDMSNPNKNIYKRNSKWTMQIKIVSLILALLIVIATTISSLVYLQSKAIITSFLTSSVDDKIAIIDNKLNSLTETTEKLADIILNSGKLKSTITAEQEQELYTYFEQFLNVYPEIVNLIFSRADCVYIYPLNASVSNQVPSQASWYTDRLSEPTESNWKEPYIDAATNQWIVTYYKRVVENGQIIGFIEIDISLTHIIELINSVKLGEQGYLFVTNYDGVIAIHNIEELIGKDIPDEELRKKVSESADGQFAYESVKESKYVKFKTLNNAIEWKAISIMPEKHLYSVTSSLLLKIILYISIVSIFTILISIIIVSRIVRNVKKLNTCINYLGQGDLTVQCDVKTSDEIGEMGTVFNHSVHKMNTLIKNTQLSCHDMLAEFKKMDVIAKESADATHHITESIAEMSMGAQEQASETEHIVREFDEVSSAMQEISESIVTLNKQVEYTQTTNEGGLQVVKNLLLATEETNQSTDKVRNSIHAISNTSVEIDAIVQVINEIADETNLLALNASIEAARAGESGKGFAVVADQVRKLAENSATSANDIKLLIDTIKTQSKTAVAEMELAKENSIIQNEAVAETEKTFDTLYTSVETLGKDINKIGDLNNHMISLKGEMEDIISNLADKAEKNSEVTQEISSTTEEQLAIILNLEDASQTLTALAKQVEDEMNQFTT